MNSIRYMAHHNPQPKPPTDAENRALCWAARHAETEAERLAARNELILRNQGLVHKMASPFVGRCPLSIDDLIGEGQFGLIRAVEKFDFERGCAFTTIAGLAVRRAIQEAIRNRANVIRIPKNYQSDRFVSRHRDDAERAMRVGSLDHRIAGFLADRDAESETKDRETYRDLIDRLMVGLTASQRNVVILLYGLDPAEGEELSYSDVGRRLGCSYQRVSYLRDGAISKMRKVVRKGVGA